MKKLIVLGSVIFAYFVSFAGSIHAGDATLTLDDNAGSSSFVVQDSDKTNQFKVNSDGQGYFAGKVGIGTTGPNSDLDVIGDISIRGEIVFQRSADSLGQLLIGGLAPNGPDTIRIYTDKTEKIRVDSSGNVGIGTTNPGSKLTVAGTIESTSGGIKFPDGTTQTTAATSATTLKTYDSGWFACNSGQGYTKTHNLGTTKLMIQVYFSDSSDGSNAFTAFDGNGGNAGVCVKNITSTTFRIQASNVGCAMRFDDSGSTSNVSSGYYRAVVMSLE